jgi:hypothetical protein
MLPFFNDLNGSGTVSDFSGDFASIISDSQPSAWRHYVARIWQRKKDMCFPWVGSYDVMDLPY